MKRKDIIALVFFLFFITSFFLSFFVALKVILMGLLVVYAFAANSLKEKINLLRQRKHLWLMLAFALIILVSFFMSSNRSDGLRFLQLRLPLLLFPISIGLLQFSKELRNKILLGIAIIVSIGSLVSLCWAIYRFIQTDNAAWLYNDALSYLIGQQSIYTSLLVNISIYIFSYFLFFHPLSQGHKILLSLAIVFLFIISYLLASRSMMLVLYSSVLIFSFYYVLKKKKWLEGATLIMGLFIAGFMIFKFFPKTINRFRELAYTQFDYKSQEEESHYAGELTSDQWNGANFRLAAWRCGWQIFKEHPVTGVGLGDKKDELFKVYRQKGFQFAISTNKNVHNNYLDILFSMGIIGLLVFITGWIFLPLLQFIRNKDGLALLMLITFSIAMLTENYFDRSIGGLLFGFFIPFLLTTNSKTVTEKMD